jgi:hypothetical protein
MSAMVATIDRPLDLEYAEFEYRPVPVLVPIAGLFVFLSGLAFVWAELLFVPVIGAVLAMMAWWKIRAAAGAYTGGLTAIALLVLLLSLTGSAAAFHVYNYATELPEGFQRVSFATEISDKGFIVENGVSGLHPDVAQLNGKSVFLKGFMYPTRQTEGLKSFVLCKDSGDCCFGGQPKATDMIYVEMVGDQRVNFRTGLIAVAGTFLTQPTVDETGLQPVYRIDCERFGGAKSAY